MKPGPPPTPTPIRIAKGNPGRRPLPAAEATPEPLADLTPPEFLNDEAKAHWATLAPMLRDLGLLTVLDHTALAMMCESIARWKEAERHLRKHGLVVLSGSNNRMPIVNPYLSISRQAQKQVYGLLSEFGLTPATRSRVTAAIPTAADPDHDRFFSPGRPRLVPLTRKRRPVTPA